MTVMKCGTCEASVDDSNSTRIVSDHWTLLLCHKCLSEIRHAPEGVQVTPLTKDVQDYVDDWLSSNEKWPHQVYHAVFPIGMVMRWIERAEAAEASVSAVRHGLESVVLQCNRCAASMSPVTRATAGANCGKCGLGVMKIIG